MNPIEKLKEMECRHGSGWRFQDNTDDKSVSDECRFLNAFIGMRKELIALWEAVEASKGPLCSCPTIIKALNELNAKAEEVLK